MIIPGFQLGFAHLCIVCIRVGYNTEHVRIQRLLKAVFSQFRSFVTRLLMFFLCLTDNIFRNLERVLWRYMPVFMFRQTFFTNEHRG